MPIPNSAIDMMQIDESGLVIALAMTLLHLTLCWAVCFMPEWKGNK